MNQTDILTIMQGYLEDGHGSPLEKMIVSRAMAEIKMHRELGDSPIQSLVIRNADLVAENRKLRDENNWFRMIDREAHVET